MRKTACVLACALALAAMPTAQAYTVGATSTIGNVVWFTSFTSSTFGSCTNMTVDVTGDFANSNRMVVYGALNCGGFGYNATGNMFVGADGSLNFNVVFAGYTLNCPRIVGLTGICNLFDASGIARGTASLFMAV